MVSFSQIFTHSITITMSYWDYHLWKTTMLFSIFLKQSITMDNLMIGCDWMLWMFGNTGALCSWIGVLKLGQGIPILAVTLVTKQLARACLVTLFTHIGMWVVMYAVMLGDWSVAVPAGSQGLGPRDSIRPVISRGLSCDHSPTSQHAIFVIGVC